MANLIIVENPEDCPLDLEKGADTKVLAAWSYLTDTEQSHGGNIKVFNLCRSQRYQSLGYYVSLLAEARGHKAFPSVLTIQDMKSVGLLRLTSDELDELLGRQLGALTPKGSPGPEHLALDIFFGKVSDGRLAQLAMAVYLRFPAPFLRVVFHREGRDAGPGNYTLQNVSAISPRDVPPEERDFAAKAAEEFFAARRQPSRRRRPSRFDMAILHNPDESTPPSDKKALEKCIKAAGALGMSAELITREDAGRIFEFDALFIRETTSVDHHTYRMARKAAAEGLVVIDDPQSILRCSNKVYLAELLARNKIPAPATIIAHSHNLDQVLTAFDFPVICKEPDSSFSQGVVKAHDKDELQAILKRLLDRSELVIVQEYAPSEFDWRIGVLERQPLYACKYFMASKHWQIIRRDANGKMTAGKVETVPVEFVPPAVLKTALKAANLVGDGLYGVDLKQQGKGAVVIEVNDNPSIESGFEDAVLKDELYNRIMRVFVARIMAMKRGRGGL